MHTRVDPGLLNEDGTALEDSPEQEEVSYVPWGLLSLCERESMCLGFYSSSVTSDPTNFGVQCEILHP